MVSESLQYRDVQTKVTGTRVPRGWGWRRSTPGRATPVCRPLPTETHPMGGAASLRTGHSPTREQSGPTLRIAA